MEPFVIFHSVSASCVHELPWSTTNTLYFFIFKRGICEIFSFTPDKILSYHHKNIIYDIQSGITHCVRVMSLQLTEWHYAWCTVDMALYTVYWWCHYSKQSVTTHVYWSCHYSWQSSITHCVLVMLLQLIEWHHTLWTGDVTTANRVAEHFEMEPIVSSEGKVVWIVNGYGRRV